MAEARKKRRPDGGRATTEHRTPMKFCFIFLCHLGSTCFCIYGEATVLRCFERYGWHRVLAPKIPPTVCYLVFCDIPQIAIFIYIFKIHHLYNIYKLPAAHPPKPRISQTTKAHEQGHQTRTTRTANVTPLPLCPALLKQRTSQPKPQLWDSQSRGARSP